jgi:6-phosphogluconolactonase (cycloisomerase 2 family)
MRPNAAQSARRRVLAQRDEVYAAAAEPGALVAFDVRDERLRPESVHLDAGADAVAEACAVAVSPDGAHVYVAGYGHNAIALFRRAA